MSDLELWKERALAAEKTAEVLKAKVWALYNGESLSPLQRQLERSQKRQDDARRRHELSVVRELELARYSRTLENEVKARTRDVRTILDHVTSGLLIVGDDLVVRPGFSTSCHRLLATSSVAGRHLADLLRIEAQKDREHLVLLLEQIFADLMPEELSIDFVPRRFPVGDRVISLETRVIREEGLVSGLLMTINDITSLEEAQRQVSANEVLIGILTQRTAFQTFVVDSRASLAAARDAVASGADAFVRRALHTVKGNAAAFKLADVVAVVHRVESEASIGIAEIDAVEEVLRTFLAANHSVLDVRFDLRDDESFVVPRTAVDALRAVSTDADEVQRWTDQLVLKRVDHVTGPLGQYTEKLGERLEKEILFELHGGDVLVDARHLRPILQSLPHVLRNAVDHGLEAPGERGEKPARGLVAVSFRDEGDRWVVSVRDDGRGIDGERVADAAIAKGLVDREMVAKMTPAERMALVFLDGLSTREVATNLSGRGMGMSATRAAVDRLHGKVTIESAVGAGTCVTMCVPKAQRP